MDEKRAFFFLGYKHNYNTELKNFLRYTFSLLQLLSIEVTFFLLLFDLFCLNTCFM